MPRRHVWLSLAVMLFVSPLLVHAAPLPLTTPAVYTFTVTGSGSLDGISFTDEVITFTTTTTLGAITMPNSNVDHVTQTPTTVSVAGVGSDSLTNHISFSISRSSKSAGVADSTAALSVLVLVDNAFGSISMFDDVGPVSGTALQVTSFTDETPTTNGDLLISSVLTGTGSYTASINPTPEPSSLLLLGTGMVGMVGAIRKRLA